MSNCWWESWEYKFEATKENYHSIASHQKIFRLQFSRNVRLR